jgi:hypothetical protein
MTLGHPNPSRHCMHPEWCLLTASTQSPMSASQQAVAWRLSCAIPADDNATPSARSNQISCAFSNLPGENLPVYVHCLKFEVQGFKDHDDVCCCHGVVGTLFEDIGEKGLRVICATEGLFEELVMVLEEIGTELAAGTGQRVEVVEVKMMRERFDDTGDRRSAYINKCARF